MVKAASLGSRFSSQIRFVLHGSLLPVARSQKPAPDQETYLDDVAVSTQQFDCSVFAFKATAN